MRDSFKGWRVRGLEGLRGSCAYSVARRMAPGLWVEVRGRWPDEGAKSGRGDMPCARAMRCTDAYA
eukprot:CAMPEP_0119517378 /NCGR_PEP_ID=MMETSP1344-20130328/34294_1 /TAXON_ID=236787 /ORGANISM="Florenciella parvula, Strain CCMP2471" /LENGTH=65 /DNA_ID=CAMNT_0007554967 /DNA_START=10 /DNA_END=207 /DNA_ORIENTATION=+